MNLQQTLTKENFWNEIYSKYPNATKLFCDWIDEYKKAVNWQVLFNPHFKVVEETTQIHSTPKFHDLPHAIQQGIWIEFANDILNEYFEQPEYQYCMDLEEDIELVLSELEKDILSDLEVIDKLVNKS